MIHQLASSEGGGGTLFSLISSYQRTFVSTVLESVLAGWDQMVEWLVWLYGEGGIGLTAHAFWSEMEDGE